MKGGARIAVGVGIGYFLGRTHKMRLALMLAGAGLSGRLPGTPQELMKRGVSALGSSPELGKITESVRGELLGAARAAAVTAASNQIDSLNDRLQHGGGLLRSKGARTEDEGYEEPEDEYDEEEREDESADVTEEERPTGRRSGADDTDTEGPEEEESEADRKPAPKRPATRRRSSASAAPARSRSAPSRKKTDENDEEAPKPRRRTSRTETSAAGRAPVRRTRS